MITLRTGSREMSEAVFGYYFRVTSGDCRAYSLGVTRRLSVVVTRRIEKRDSPETSHPINIRIRPESTRGWELHEQIRINVDSRLYLIFLFLPVFLKESFDLQISAFFFSIVIDEHCCSHPLSVCCLEN